MSASDLEFRWTFGLSLIVHAAALGGIWFVGLMRGPTPLTPRYQRDVWVGTTVSVVETPREHSVSPQPQGESQSSSGTDTSKKRDAKKATEPGGAADLRKISARALQPGRADVTARPGPILANSAQQPATPRHSAAGPARDAGGVDLKQAMQNSLNQPATESGTFGAAGVDLTERRLPKAFTRALPVAVGAEPGWWKQQVGSLGSIRFKVALSETGKIEQVTFDGESQHPFHVRVIRRVAKLLALGTFALPSATATSAEQAFELKLVMEQRAADTNSTADPGDLVEKGFEAPSAGKPGQAIVRDAPGHTMRAFLRLLPEKAGGALSEASE